MCGILFTDKLTRNTRRILPHLAVAMESRGTDSWGYTDGNRVMKFVNTITENFHVPRGWDERPFICHTRAASVGEVIIENAHPFDYTNETTRHRVVGIHNGGVRNWRALNVKYNREFTCDSMHIFKHLADAVPVKDLDMSGVIVWMENHDGIVRYTRSSSTAISIAKLKTGEIIGCSEEIPLRRACRIARCEIDSFWNVDDELEYCIADGTIYSDRKMPFDTEYTISFHGQQQVHGGHHNAGFPSGSNTSGSSGKVERGGNSFAHPKGIYTKCTFCGGTLDASLDEVVLCSKDLERFVEFMDRDARKQRVLLLPPAPNSITTQDDLNDILPPTHEVTEYEHIDTRFIQ